MYNHILHKHVNNFQQIERCSTWNFFFLSHENELSYDRDFCITYLIRAAKNVCFMQYRFINRLEIVRWGCFFNFFANHFDYLDLNFKKAGARYLLNVNKSFRRFHVKFIQFSYPNYLLSKPQSVWIENSLTQSMARNLVTKLQISYRPKGDQAFIAYHAANWLARRPNAVPGNT